MSLWSFALQTAYIQSLPHDSLFFGTTSFFIFTVVLKFPWDVNKKLLLSISNLVQQQAAVTQANNDAIIQLLDYVATYPSEGITFRDSDMVLAAHSNAAYLNVTKSRSRAGAYIILSEDVPVPT